jgi:hypothetical protein
MEDRHRTGILGTLARPHERCSEGDGMVRKPQAVDRVIEGKYREMIERVLRRKNAIAQLQLQTGKAGVDLTISVVPRNPKAAPMELDVADKDFVFLHVGRGTTFEIPDIGGVNLPVGQEEQIELLTTAVVEGRFEEDLVYSGEHLISGKGTVHFPHRDVSSSWSRLTIRRLTSKAEEHVKYEPYL